MLATTCVGDGQRRSKTKRAQHRPPATSKMASGTSCFVRGSSQMEMDEAAHSALGMVPWAASPKGDR